MSNNRFLHEEAYRGEGLVEKLSQVNIVICGAGTIGSNLADTLARQGFRRLTLIDMDRVEEHNINTQIYGEGDIGAVKVDAARNRLFRDVGVEIETFNKELTHKTSRKFLKGDLIIDAFDNRASRQLLQDWSRNKDVPCLHVGMFEDYGEVVWDDIYKVPEDQVDGDVCEYPLARNLAMLVVTVAAEEVLNFCLANKPRKWSRSVTLKDLQIKPY